MYESDLSAIQMEQIAVPEQEKRKPQMIDLLHLSEEDRNEFIQSVEATRKPEEAQNTVQIWVHMFYKEEELNNLTEEQKLYFIGWDTRDAYLQNREILIANRVRSNLQTIAFIPVEADQSEVEKYATGFETTGDAGKVYYIRTFPDDPTPLMQEDPSVQVAIQNSDSAILKKILTTHKKENWDATAQLFQKLHIQRAIISGELASVTSPIPEMLLDEEGRAYFQRHPELQVTSPEIPPDRVRVELPSGCVGMVKAYLENRGIDISSSRVSFPSVKPANTFTNTQ